MLVRNYWKWS